MIPPISTDVIDMSSCENLKLGNRLPDVRELTECEEFKGIDTLGFITKNCQKPYLKGGTDEDEITNSRHINAFVSKSEFQNGVAETNNFNHNQNELLDKHDPDFNSVANGSNDANDSSTLATAETSNSLTMNNVNNNNPGTTDVTSVFPPANPLLMQPVYSLPQQQSSLINFDQLQTPSCTPMYLYFLPNNNLGPEPSSYLIPVPPPSLPLPPPHAIDPNNIEHHHHHANSGLGMTGASVPSVAPAPFLAFNNNPLVNNNGNNVVGNQQQPIFLIPTAIPSVPPSHGENETCCSNNINNGELFVKEATNDHSDNLTKDVQANNNSSTSADCPACFLEASIRAMGGNILVNPNIVMDNTIGAQPKYCFINNGNNNYSPTPNQFVNGENGMKKDIFYPPPMPLYMNQSNALISPIFTAPNIFLNDQNLLFYSRPPDPLGKNLLTPLSPMQIPFNQTIGNNYWIPPYSLVENSSVSYNDNDTFLQKLSVAQPKEQQLTAWVNTLEPKRHKKKGDVGSSRSSLSSLCESNTSSVFKIEHTPASSIVEENFFNSSFASTNYVDNANSPTTVITSSTAIVTTFNTPNTFDQPSIIFQQPFKTPPFQPSFNMPTNGFDLSPNQSDLFKFSTYPLLNFPVSIYQTNTPNDFVFNPNNSSYLNYVDSSLSRHLSISTVSTPLPYLSELPKIDIHASSPKNYPPSTIFSPTKKRNFVRENGFPATEQKIFNKGVLPLTSTSVPNYQNRNRAKYKANQQPFTLSETTPNNVSCASSKGLSHKNNGIKYAPYNNGNNLSPIPRRNNSHKYAVVSSCENFSTASDGKIYLVANSKAKYHDNGTSSSSNDHHLVMGDSNKSTSYYNNKDVSSFGKMNNHINDKYNGHETLHRLPDSPDYGLGSDVESSQTGNSDNKTPLQKMAISLKQHQQQPMAQLMAHSLSRIGGIHVKNIESRSACVVWKPVEILMEESMAGISVTDIDVLTFDPVYKLYAHQISVKQPSHKDVIISSIPVESTITNNVLVYHGPLCEYLLKDLQPGTQYEIFLEAFACNYRGERSKSVTFKTCSESPDCPSAPSLIYHTKNSLTLQWDSLINDNGSNIIYYTLQMGEIHDTINNIKNTVNNNATPMASVKFSTIYRGDDKQFKVSNLKGSTTYAFRLSATNSIGTSSFSDPRECCYTLNENGTLFIELVEKPNPLTLIRASHDSLLLAWKHEKSELSATSSLSIIIQCQNETVNNSDFLTLFNGSALRFWNKASNDYRFKIGSDQINDHISYSFSPKHTYKFRLKTFDEDGQSLWSDTVSYQVASKPIEPRERFCVKEVTPTTIQLYWDHSKDSILPVSYQIYMWDESIDNQTLIYQGYDNEFLVQNLNPGHQYCFKILSISSPENESCHMGSLMGVCTPPTVPESMDGKLQITNVRQLDKNATVITTSKVSAASKTVSLPNIKYEIDLDWSCKDIFDGGSPIINYVVEMCLEPENLASSTHDKGTLRFKQASQKIYEGPTPFCRAKELKPNTTYYFRACAINSVGPGPWSNWLHCSATTSCQGLPPAPKHFAVKVKSPHSVSFGIVSQQNTTTQDNDDTPPITKYRIEVSSKANDFTLFCEIGVVEDGNVEYKGLNHAHTYAFRACAVNKIGCGPFTPTVTVEMPPYVPSQIASNSIKCVSKTPTSLDLVWDGPCDSGGSLIQKYAIEVEQIIQNKNQQIKSPTTTTYVTDNAETTAYTVSGLLPYNTYRIRIQAINEIGVGAFSHPAQTFLTPAAKLLEAPNFIVSQCGCLLSTQPTTLKLKWDFCAHKNHSGTMTNHDVIRYELEMADYRKKFQSIYFGDGTSYKVSKLLNENTAYDFRVRTHNESGYGPYSTNLTLQTDWSFPIMVKKPKVNNTKQNGCHIFWPYPSSPYQKQCPVAYNVTPHTTWQYIFELYLSNGSDLTSNPSIMSFESGAPTITSTEEKIDESLTLAYRGIKPECFLKLCPATDYTYKIIVYREILQLTIKQDDSLDTALNVLENRNISSEANLQNTGTNTELQPCKNIPCLNDKKLLEQNYMTLKYLRGPFSPIFSFKTSGKNMLSNTDDNINSHSVSDKNDCPISKTTNYNGNNLLAIMYNALACGIWIIGIKKTDHGFTNMYHYMLPQFVRRFITHFTVMGRKSKNGDEHQDNHHQNKATRPHLFNRLRTTIFPCRKNKNEKTKNFLRTCRATYTQTTTISVSDQNRALLYSCIFVCLALLTTTVLTLFVKYFD